MSQKKENLDYIFFVILLVLLK